MTQNLTSSSLSADKADYDKQSSSEIRADIDQTRASVGDKIDQLQSLIHVAEEALSVRTEAARLADRQFEQNAALESAREDAHAKVASAKASLLEANLSLLLAQGDLKRTIGEMPR